MFNYKLELKAYMFWFVFLIVLLQIFDYGKTTDEISNHIKNCCNGGKTLAKEQNTCQNYEYDILSISPLWRGLCLSTYAVCCSHELEKIYCVSGRLAALTGSRCNEQYNTTFYSDCCRACQIGLAVKASGNVCNDTIFSYFADIESFRICCGVTTKNNRYDLKPIDKINSTKALSKTDVGIESSNQENVDGTIILQDDDDDICGKFRLCEQICENTKESYVCKCHPGFKLADNLVTCTPISDKGNNSNKLEIMSSFLTSNRTSNTTTLDELEVIEDRSNVDFGDDVDKEVVDDELKEIVMETTCPKGFEIDPLKLSQCVDINECLVELHDCRRQQTCVNFNGSYSCVNGTSKKCEFGFSYNKQTKKCEEVSSLNTFKNLSLKQQYGKKCDDGFQWRNDNCMDINECEIDDTACDSSQVCVNDIGGYHCDCKIGFSLDTTTSACVDINECSINNHNCLPTQRCDNTIGSYVCTRLQSCGTGYTLNADSSTCDDNDECALKTHNCKDGWECYNTKGSFRCYPKQTTTTSTTTTTQRPSTTSTYSSYYPSPYYNYHPHVSDKSTTHRSISPSSIYKNVRVYSPCETGLQRNHLGVCVDINECETGEHNCADNQICHNRNGGYVCSCPEGHHLTHIPNGESRCVDINECDQRRLSLCPSNAQCINTIGSYFCECKSGFQKNRENERICLDVDECNEIPGLCHQKCVNFFGGYRCTCNSGYELGPDNRTCIDVDECEVNQTHKLCMGFCENVAGSYECSCPRGYTLASDRNTCLDIDECATEEFCTGRNDVCTNKRGGYKCTTIHCPFGYINDPEQKTRCRLTNNMCEGEDCFNKPSAYTYNFITFVSRMMVPIEGRTFFSLKGPVWYDDIEFDMKIVKIQAAVNIEKATNNHFGTTKGNHEVNLILKRSLEGPQEVEIDVTMTVFTRGLPRGKSVAKVFIIVSQYTF